MKKSQKAAFRADAKKMITSNIHHAGKEMRRRGMPRNQSLVLQLVHFLSVHGRCIWEKVLSKKHVNFSHITLVSNCMKNNFMVL